MVDPQTVHRQMEQHYERVWQAGDAWELESSAYEQTRYDRQLALIADRQYASVLEIGCGSGGFTRRLSGLSGRLLAIDIASAAIERARAAVAEDGSNGIELRVGNIMEYDPAAEGPWDLIVLSETIYCLGWLYPFSEIGWLAARLLESTREGGRLLLANTYGGERDWLLRPWLIDTYRDLFANVGFQREREEIFQGTKEGCDFRVLMTVFAKLPAINASEATRGAAAT